MNAARWPEWGVTDEAYAARELDRLRRNFARTEKACRQSRDGGRLATAGHGGDSHSTRRILENLALTGTGFEGCRGRLGQDDTCCGSNGPSRWDAARSRGESPAGAPPTLPSASLQHR